MIITLTHQQIKYLCNLSEPLDISIPIGQVRCFNATVYQAKPYESGDFIGSVKHGAPVNFFDVQLNPHGNGTHTECLGHITKVQESVNDQLKTYHHLASLITIVPTTLENGDQVIDREQLEVLISDNDIPALIIRTLPNEEAKLSKDYSGTNPCYLTGSAMKYIVSLNVKHLLLDLPSVDREVDEGKLKAHHIFWGITKENKVTSRSHCTITELIYVPNDIEDGIYLLNIQIPTMELDAAPSKPVLYRLLEN